MASNTKKQTNAWDAAIRITNRFLTAGYAIPLLCVLGFSVCLWIVSRQLDSKDMKELVLGLTDRLSFRLLGWILFLATTSIYAFLFRWTSRSYENEIARQREIIDRLLPPPDNTLKLKE
jgi:hypothetical protein